MDDHFGHCDHYTIYTVEAQQVVAEQTLPSPQGCGCKSGIASTLEQMGVEVMLAGNMGLGAKNKLESHNIRVVRGCHGEVKALVADYLAGRVEDSGKGCESHECGEHKHEHECHHSQD